ncbi:MAG: N-acetylmuramoyl-L-alanine amidase [Candidatus Aegiribacteria sp.]|nr:N-acetylmuramoyl-L-alanine amidase [Candidatus Aegiribacteria sp.]
MKIKYLILHHSAISYNKNPDQLKAINAYHEKRWNSKGSLGYYIGYHYVINKVGKITRTRSRSDVGIHCRAQGMNYKSLGIMCEGNFDIELPTKKQEESLTKLLKELRIMYSNVKIAYHRNFYNTHCPGLKISDDWAKNLISNNKTMEYVEQGGEQYIRYTEPFNIAFNIGDPEEEAQLKKLGLPNVKPRIVTDMDKYEVYPLVSKPRMAKVIKELRDLTGF